MEEVIVVQNIGWQAQLEQLYPKSKKDVSTLAQKYLRDILDRSSSPIAVLIWKPSVTDWDWAKALLEIKKMKIQGASRLEIIMRMGELVRNTGHTALVWRSESKEVGYASFWPDLAADDKNASGIFKTFAQDLNSEEKLPDVIKANLSKSSRATLIDRRITGWDIPTLCKDFDRLKANPPVFDLKSRDGAKCCASLVLDLLQKGCQTEWFGHCLKFEVREVARRCREQPWYESIGHVLFSTILLPAATLSDTVRVLSDELKRTELYFRKHSINPNLIDDLVGTDDTLARERAQHVPSVHFIGINVKWIDSRK